MSNWFADTWNKITNTGEKRAASVSAENYSPALERIFGLNIGGTTVNENTAMRISAVYGCVRVLSEGIAKLPFQVFEQTDSGKKLATSHPAYNLIRNEPNRYMTAFSFWQSIMAITLLWGNGYARIIRGTGQRPTSLKLYAPGTVDLIESDGVLFAQTEDGLIPDYDIFHLRGLGTGIIGKSPIRQQAENLGISLNAQTFANKFFENGANVSGVLKHPGKLSDSAYKNLRDSWAERYSGTSNSHRPAILEEGMDFTKISIPPNEAQMLETRLFGVAEICRLYGVPPHKVAELSKATFSNIEHLNIEWMQDGMLPWFARIEQEANRKLFRENEKGRFYTKFNANAILRGDSAARATYYKEMFNIGVLNQNEIRELEEQNPIEGGDRYYIQGNNMIPIDRVDDIVNAQTAPKTQNTQGNEG